MAQDLSEKELLRMEVEQLKKEVKNPRDPVSLQSRLLSASSSLSFGNSEETLGPGLISGLGWDLEDSWGPPHIPGHRGEAKGSGELSVSSPVSRLCWPCIPSRDSPSCLPLSATCFLFDLSPTLPFF